MPNARRFDNRIAILHNKLTTSANVSPCGIQGLLVGRDRLQRTFSSFVCSFIVLLDLDPPHSPLDPFSASSRTRTTSTLHLRASCSSLVYLLDLQPSESSCHVTRASLSYSFSLALHFVSSSCKGIFVALSPHLVLPSAPVCTPCPLARALKECHISDPPHRAHTSTRLRETTRRPSSVSTTPFRRYFSLALPNSR